MTDDCVARDRARMWQNGNEGGERAGEAGEALPEEGEKAELIGHGKHILHVVRRERPQRNHQQQEPLAGANQALGAEVVPHEGQNEVEMELDGQRPRVSGGNSSSSRSTRELVPAATVRARVFAAVPRRAYPMHPPNGMSMLMNSRLAHACSQLLGRLVAWKTQAFTSG